ncbi:hypothetical protein VTK26DRAFT_5635 [Humicola hyalothermophila]
MKVSLTPPLGLFLTRFLRPTIYRITTTSYLHQVQQQQQRPVIPVIPVVAVAVVVRAMHLQGGCVCGRLRYSLDLDSAGDARTTLCHCRSCRRAFGTNYGLTAKVPLRAFRYERASGQPRRHRQEENGVTREFCGECGAFICEYGEAAADKFRYVVWGSLDEPDKLPPKGEFFCKDRASWMPEVPGVFHKREIME